MNKQGTSGALREFCAGLREPRLCYFRLLTKRIDHTTNLCACSGSDDSEDDHIDDIDLNLPSLLQKEAVPGREPPPPRPPPPPPPPLVAGALATNAGRPSPATVAAAAAATAQPAQVDLTMGND